MIKKEDLYTNIYDEYSHEPDIQQALIDGTRTVTDESLFIFDKTTYTITDYIGTELDVIIPKSINSVEVKILKNTFRCSNLINAPVIPKSINSVEVKILKNTFRCSNLINAPVIPNGVTIMDGTFRGCTSLINAPIIPNSVINIESAFCGCTNLINAPIIPDSVTNIFNTFCGCTSLINAPIIPDSITIMEYAFSYCSNLINAPVIPNGVINIRETFKDCTSLINAPVIPNGVINIRETFKDCTSLINAPVIPNSVINMYNAFKNCTKLTGTILIKAKPSRYRSCLLGCSTDDGVNLIVSYIADNADIIGAIIATKSTGSHITKGINIDEDEKLKINKPIFYLYTYVDGILNNTKQELYLTNSMKSYYNYTNQIEFIRDISRQNLLIFKSLIDEISKKYTIRLIIADLNNDITVNELQQQTKNIQDICKIEIYDRFTDIGEIEVSDFNTYYLNSQKEVNTDNYIILDRSWYDLGFHRDVYYVCRLDGITNTNVQSIVASLGLEIDYLDPAN